jgi:hypothetical protein
MIALYQHVLPDGDYSHRGLAGQQVRQNAVVARVQMLNQHKSHGRIGKQLLQELRQRLQPTCRRTHANHGQSIVG